MAKPLLYILCGNTAYNRGDRGNFLSQIALLRARFPDATLITDSHRPHIDKDWYDAVVLKRGWFFTREQRAWLARCDAVIWGGGALLCDHCSIALIPWWYIRIWYIKRILKKPVMAWAQGVVLQTSWGKFLAKRALKLADVISLRDHTSVDVCRNLLPQETIHYTADPGILIADALQDQEKGKDILRREHILLDKPIICIAPTFWHLYHHPYALLPYPLGRALNFAPRRNASIIRQYLEGLSRLAATLAKAHDATILFMPRYPCKPWQDVAHCRQAAKGANLPGRVHVFTSDHYPPAEFFALWRCFDMVISVALHDAIFAQSIGTPSLHLHYEAKGVDFFETLKAPAQLIPWQVVLEKDGDVKITARAAEIMQHWSKLQQQARPEFIAMQQRARSNADLLAEMMKRHA